MLHVRSLVSVDDGKCFPFKRLALVDSDCADLTSTLKAVVCAEQCVKGIPCRVAEPQPSTSTCTLPSPHVVIFLLPDAREVDNVLDLASRISQSGRIFFDRMQFRYCTRPAIAILDSKCRQQLFHYVPTQIICEYISNAARSMSFCATGTFLSCCSCRSGTLAARCSNSPAPRR